MRRECREHFPRHQFHWKSLFSDPGMHHGTCITHVLWSMSGSLTRRGGGDVPGIPGACATRNFTYLVGGPWATIIAPSHRGLNKVAHILKTVFSIAFYWMKITCVLIHISVKFAYKGPIDNKTALVQVMAWYRTITGLSGWLSQRRSCLMTHICVTKPKWCKN